LFVRRGVGSSELEELVAGGGVEQVGRAGGKAVVVVTACPNQGRVAADRHGTAEIVVHCGVGGGDLGFQIKNSGPCRHRRQAGR